MREFTDEKRRQLDMRRHFTDVYGVYMCFLFGFVCLYHRPPPLSTYAILPIVLTIVHFDGTYIISLHNIRVHLAYAFIHKCI
jgi:hypothetical protein